MILATLVALMGVVHTGTVVCEPLSANVSVHHLKPKDSACLWTLHVDYEGNDVASVSAPNLVNCCFACSLHPLCSVWTWTNYNGGTCWLKSGPSTPVYREDAHSGLTVPSYPSDGYFFGRVNCDIDGYDIGNTRGSNYMECYAPCIANRLCWAFVWSDYNGGTCWLKRRVRACKSSYGLMNGVMARPVFYGDDL